MSWDENGDDTYPVLVAVSSKEDVVSNIVVVQMLKSAVSVGDIALRRSVLGTEPKDWSFTYTPVVTRKNLTIAPILSDARKDDLIANDSPGSASVLRLTKRSIEPVLLTTSHESAAGIISNHVDVVVVPVEAGDAAVVVSSVEDDQI